mgnify:CR=1 FL=1
MCSEASEDEDTDSKDLLKFLSFSDLPLDNTLPESIYKCAILKNTSTSSRHSKQTLLYLVS